MMIFSRFVRIANKRGGWINHGVWPKADVGYPLTAAEVDSPYFEDGVSCPYCHEACSEADRARFRERQKQIALAKKRGKTHIGS